MWNSKILAIPLEIIGVYVLNIVYEAFEDTKGVIRIRKSKKDRKHNGQKKKDKRTNNDLQNINLKIE
jgi:hypothetical protein